MAARLPNATDPWVRTSEPLLWLTGAGHEFRTSAADYFHDARRRTDSPHYVLQLTLAGAGFFEKNRRRHLLPTGCAFLHQIPGPCSYGYPRERRDTYELVFVSLGGPAAFRWCARVVAAHGHVLRFAPDAAGTIGALMLDLARSRSAAAAPRDRYLVSAQLNLLVMTILSSLSQSRLAVRPLVTRALELIRQHAPERRFDVAGLAAGLGCSREHLARAFRAGTGVSPSDYLAQHRLRLAAGALRSTTEKVDAVARRCGFSGANYLCRTFRQRVGVTPAQFRRRPWLAGP